MDRRVHGRYLAHFQVRVTNLATPEVTASGEGIDVSESGIDVFLRLRFIPGTAVELNINESELFGVVTHSIPERSFFRTGIEVWQVLLGTSDLAQLLKATLHEVMPTLQLETAVLDLSS
jgi:hypothetical protein